MRTEEEIAQMTFHEREDYFKFEVMRTLEKLTGDMELFESITGQKAGLRKKIEPQVRAMPTKDDWPEYVGGQNMGRKIMNRIQAAKDTPEAAKTPYYPDGTPRPVPDAMRQLPDFNNKPCGGCGPKAAKKSASRKKVNG